MATIFCNFSMDSKFSSGGTEKVKCMQIFEDLVIFYPGHGTSIAQSSWPVIEQEYQYDKL